jgi:hypothetical protein
MKKTLHFFPGDGSIIWMVDGRIVLRSNAWGGESPDPTIHYRVMPPRRTTPGKYVIHSYGPYRTNTWPMSRIQWGTKLKLSPKGDVMFETGERRRRWMRVEDRIPHATTSKIQQFYFSMYGNDRRHDSNGDHVPDIWVFNDFGPKAVRYFKDKNHNKKLDPGESLSGEMIHTTPKNEGQASTGAPVTLEASHGCIHVAPADRDRLHAAGAFRSGTDLVIHGYDEHPSALLK